MTSLAASRGPFRATSIMSEDRLSTWLGFAKFALGTFTLGLVTTLVNSSIQTREVELREQEQVGQFLQHAPQEDVGVRRRFAQYFATVTRSTRLREGWARYSGLVEREYEETLREKEELGRAIRSRGVPVEGRYVPGFETSSRVRQRTRRDQQNARLLGQAPSDNGPRGGQKARLATSHSAVTIPPSTRL